jgi:mono/diheme cytochrome c family protein
MRWIGLTVKAAAIVALLIYSYVHAAGASSVSGEELYDSYCGTCHGFNGVPLLPNAPDFSGGERMDKSDSELLDSIRDGKGKAMPGWLGILSEEECEAVLQYIREVLT